MLQSARTSLAGGVLEERPRRRPRPSAERLVGALIRLDHAGPARSSAGRSGDDQAPRGGGACRPRRAAARSGRPGITAYFSNRGTIEHAQQIAVTVDEIGDQRARPVEFASSLLVGGDHRQAARRNRAPTVATANRGFLSGSIEASPRGPGGAVHEPSVDQRRSSCRCPQGSGVC